MGAAAKLVAAARHAARACGFGQVRCPCCLEPFLPDGGNGSSSGLCPACESSLPRYSGPRCVCCGLPLATPDSTPPDSLCGRCLFERPPFGRCAFFGLYEGNLRQLVLRLKFGGELALVRPLGALMLEACPCLPRPDILTAVPQHARHMTRRGFNQAHELARELGRLTGFAVHGNAVSRIAPGRPQEGLSAVARRKNVAGIFRANPLIVMNKRVWLVDDVVTTGSTAAESCVALCSAGAAEVNVICLARTQAGAGT